MIDPKLFSYRLFSRGLLFLLSTLTLLLSSEVLARTELYTSEKAIQINQQIQLFREQPNEQLTIEKVLQRRTEFISSNDSNPNYGFSAEAVWFLAQLNNRSDTSQWVIDVAFAQNQKVDFYLVSDGELLASSFQGQISEARSHRYPSFDVELPFAEDIELYIRIKSPHQALVAPVWVSPLKISATAKIVDSIWWGMFYGGLAILIFYNIVLYWVTREKSLIAYGFYIASVLFWQFVWGGNSHQVMSTQANLWFAQHIETLFIFVALAAGYFTLAFLNAENTAPKTRKMMLAVMTALGILMMVSVMGLLPHAFRNSLVYGITIIAVCCYLTAGIESYLNKFHPARYFVFAWSILLLSALIGLLGLVGILPSNAFTTYCFQVGVVVEAALFSVALIEKTRQQMESDASTVTHDLVNNLQIIEEQNVHLDIARKEAVKASNVKSQFLANMSHEIRTPLNAIIGFSQELSKLSLALEQQEHVQIINQSATNLLAIVNDVLDFSKIEAGRLQINEEAFSPGDLLEELVFVFAKAAQRKQLTFYYEPCPLPKMLLADGSRFKQVLTNLLSNAVKFTNRGFVSMSVSLRTIEGNHLEWHVKIEDTGIGIAAEDKAKLFQSFSQLDDSLNRNYQGTGLGLVISQQLIHLMNGSLRFESEYGLGSCFEMTIPCQNVSEHFDLEVSADWRDKQILLLDTNPRSRLASAKILHGLGARVTSGSSFKWLQEQYDEFDYFFTDEKSLEQCAEDQVARLIRTLDASERVLLVDANGSPTGPFSEHFHRLLESPLLVSRLLNFHRGEEQSTNNIWNERLFKLPAVNILAVDDMPINLRLLGTWLQESPIELTLCYSGEDALKCCKETEFDLILMDVQMPDMDGIEATRLIRKTNLNQGTPVIAVTAHAFKEEQERLLNSGMDDYLPKPLEFGALLNVIQRWCSTPEHNITMLSDIDWQLALSRANKSEKIAGELLEEFAQQLPDSLVEIEKAYRLQNWKLMQQQVHRLHGASCYTGVPKLQRICAEIEIELKEEHFSEAKRKFPELKSAIESVLSQQASMTRTQ